MTGIIIRVLFLFRNDFSDCRFWRKYRMTNTKVEKLLLLFNCISSFLVDFWSYYRVKRIVMQLSSEAVAAESALAVIIINRTRIFSLRR